MTIFDLPQTNREELLDLHHGSLHEVRRSLHDIQRINTYIGGARIICDATIATLKKHHLRSATVLDIGTGNADIPQRLVKLAKKHGIELRVFALDISARHLQVAQEDIRPENRHCVAPVQADAFHLPFGDCSIDLVISTLFLHHFRAPQLHQLLCEFQRVSRRGFVMNDLVRHSIPLWFFRLLRPIFARSYLTRHDGEASIRRAYTFSEMQHLVESSPIDIEVRAHFPFRISLTHHKLPCHQSKHYANKV